MRELSDLIGRYETRLDQVYRYALAALATNVIVRTPVDTGTLRASWTPAIGRLDGSNAGGDLLSVINAVKAGDRFTLVNGQPYAREIEYLGHSRQAPQGMLRRSTAEWPSLIRAGIARAQ